VATSPRSGSAASTDDKPENFFGSSRPTSISQDLRRLDDDRGEQTFQAGRNSFVAKKLEESSLEAGRPSSCAARTSRWTLDLVRRELPPGDESNIFFSNEVLNQGKWFGANKYTGLYYTKIARSEDIPRVTAAIDRMFENSDAPTKSMTEKQFQLQFMEMMGNVKGLIHGISIVILFAVTLIVANTVAMSARERVTEIAVMRTLGFRRTHILGFILSESVLMSLLGGVLGVVLAKYFFIPGMVKGMETSPMAPFMLNFKVTWAVLASAFGISVGVGVLAGFVPAIHSSQVKIVDELRQVV
jgi:hypothetical protein